MTVEMLEKDLNSGKLNSLYLLYGEELFLLETCLKKIKKIFGEYIIGINYIVIDEQRAGEILANLETPSFGYDKKLIIVKNSGLFKKEGKKKNKDILNYKEKLENYITKNIETISRTVVLIFIEEDVEKNSLYSIIDKNGIVCKFDYQKPLQIENRIKRICNGYKVKIDSRTIKYLIESCGTNMQILINEIRKLIEYAGENGVITIEDIDNLCIKNMDSIIFDLTDNLGKKNITESLKILYNLIYNKEPVVKILVSLYNHFKRLYITKLSLKYNKDLIESLKLKPNQVFLTNKYKMQSGYFKEEELRNILQSLCDLDYNFKQGKIDLEIGLETVLCKYCSIA